MKTNSTVRLTDRSSDLTIAFCFLAVGWALLSSGRILSGGIVVVMAAVWPSFGLLLTRYQHYYATRERARRVRESTLLLENARSELKRFSKNK